MGSLRRPSTAQKSYRGGNKELNSLVVNQKTRLEMQAGARRLNRLQAFAKWYDPMVDEFRIPPRDGSEYLKDNWPAEPSLAIMGMGLGGEAGEPRDGSTKEDRARALWDWIHTYDIDIAIYEQTEAIVLTVAGATFADRKEEFPSELLFANVAMAVKSGAVEKRR